MYEGINPKVVQVWENLKPKIEPLRMTAEERKQFVLDVLANKIFSSAHLRKGDDIGMVFFPLACGGVAPRFPSPDPPPEECPEDMSVDEWEAKIESHAHRAEVAKWLDHRVVEHWASLVGGFWEYHDQALPRGINGLPFFMSVRVMHIEDWKLTSEVIIREEKRLAELEV